ncbi:MAG TPA: DUF2752 domain-containing protein [Pyrinomonadaceae bacterium]|nr:DUF2752 domain-containing protein [Pyrinomonadaceae bacterium]
MKSQEAARRPWLANALAGGALLALLALMRSLATATRSSVYFAGRELHWGCAFREAFGFPCPACGMTRSVLLTLHGQLGDALAVHPAGPLLVAGGILFAAALLLSAGLQFAGRICVSPDALLRRFVLSASAYGGLTTVVLMAHWLRVIT